MAQKIERWITVNGNHIPIFEGQSKEQAINAHFKNQKRANDDADKKQKQIEANKKQAEEKNKSNKERTFESLIPEDSYTKHPNYQAAIEWFNKNGGRYNELNKQMLEAYKRVDAERDKHLNPEWAKALPKSEARLLVSELEYPEIAKLREKADKLSEEKRELEREITRRNSRMSEIDKSFAGIQREKYGRPEFKEASGEYAGFKTSESTTNYVDDKLKSGEAKVVEMTPEQYIRECAHYIFENSTIERTLRGREGNDSSTKDLIAKIKKGVKLDTPYLNYGRPGDQVGNQEGLHRAVAAHICGLDKIPVIIIGKRRK